MCHKEPIAADSPDLVSLCVIPARGCSQRFPRKNLALLRGKPLLAYSIEVAFESGVFETVCVSSESDEILAVAEEYGALPLKRPDELSGDFVGYAAVCAHALEHFSARGKTYEYFAVLLPTSPLRAVEDILEPYEILMREDGDYVISLVPCIEPPQRVVSIEEGYVTPFFGREFMGQAQTMTQLYRHDGTIIFCKSEPFLAEKAWYGPRGLAYFTPVERAVDIDVPMDLEWSEFLLSRAGEQPPE